MRRRWCVAWDGSPFCIRIDRRYWTRRGARSALARRRYADRCFITTVTEAERLDRAVWERTQAGDLPDTRFEVLEAER